MENKTVIVTGAGAGIGRATVLGLANTGAHVVVSARSEASAGAVLDQLVQSGGKGETLVMDLASPESIRNGVAGFLEKHERVDVLINNAGVWAGERVTTGEGFEVTWGVNVLAPFRLTHLLGDALRRGDGKVINLSSSQHYKGNIHWDDLQLHQNYKGERAYQQSKLAITMLSAEQAARDADLKVNAVHPGVAGTDLFRNFPAFIRFWINLLMSTPEKCAQPSLMLATQPEYAETTGKFFYKRKLREPHAMVNDTDARKRLWEVVSKQAGID
ncbi:MAG: SDR family NAD(P)-dependent oxidoreductase [Planctomycetes bacterium]|nr:SDR family NAD(P)-dependent oxidoreductase [Planctomycetota bacterium]